MVLEDFLRLICSRLNEGPKEETWLPGCVLRRTIYAQNTEAKYQYCSVLRTKWLEQESTQAIWMKGLLTQDSTLLLATMMTR